jgi:hypothetical protein
MHTALLMAVQAVTAALAAKAATATLSAGDLPFPMALELAAWPHWVVLSSLVFFYFSIGSAVIARVLPQNTTDDPSPRSEL